MNLADSLNRLSRHRQAVLAWLGQALLWLSLWLGLIHFPQPPAAGLDPSWRMALGYAAQHHLQHGVDLVFTYGPLGYLLPVINSGGLYAHHLIWQLGANAIFATIIWLFGRSFHGWRLALYYGFFWVFGVGYGDAVHMLMITLLGVALLREPVAARRWLVGLISLMLAILALVKFTNFMLACFAIACVAGHHLWRRRWDDLGLVTGGFAGGYLAGWVLCSQSLANLPAYVWNSLDASIGYGEGMAVYETPLVFFLGVGAGLSVAAYYVLSLWRRSDPPRALALMLIAAAASFLDWKHGYIRADGHVFAHYITCLLIAASYPVLLMDDGPWPRLKGWLLVLAAVFSLAGTWLISPATLTDAPAIWNYQMKTSVNALRIVPDFARNSRQEYADISKANTLTGLKAWVLHSSIDMLGNEQSYILFAGLNYTPRPALQSYFPYTSRLLRLNEQFYQSPRAPEYVAQKLDTIDYRLPALDDSLVTRYLYQHYSFLTNEAGFLLWRRNPPDPSLDAQTPLLSTTIAFGQTFRVPAHGEDPIWAAVDIRPSLLGRLRAFLYKAPLLNLKLTDDGNSEHIYRLIRDMARTGFLLHPYFDSNYAIERYERGNDPPRVASFSIELPSGQRKYFQPDIRVRLSTLKPFPRVKGPEPLEIFRAKFRMFNRVPDSVKALYTPTVLLEDNYEVLSAHPPSAIEFKMDVPASRVSGRFGLAANSYKPPNRTDGAEFILEWVANNGDATRIFYRLLQPATVEADRGFQSFDVELPKGGGRLILRTTPGPANDLSFDWAFWTDVKFTP
jgi:hypothetical protein